MSLHRTAIYLASDFHLDTGKGMKETTCREQCVLEWLSTIEQDAKEIHLVGDVWDFWFEYHHVVPKGTFRLLAKLYALVQKGIDIHFYKGNHDMWTFGFLEEEIGMHVHSDTSIATFFDEKYLIGHGDGLGPGDRGYKRLKYVFRHAFFQKCFQWIHPDIGISIAQYSSKRSRESQQNTGSDSSYSFFDKEEWLYAYSQKKIQEIEGLKYCVFGHRHIPIVGDLGNGKTYFNLGEWFSGQTYLRIDEAGPKLLAYKKDCLPQRIVSQ